MAALSRILNSDTVAGLAGLAMFALMLAGVR